MAHTTTCGACSRKEDSVQNRHTNKGKEQEKYRSRKQKQIGKEKKKEERKRSGVLSDGEDIE